MKKFIPLIVILTVLISCHEEDDFMSEQNMSESSKVFSKKQDKDDGFKENNIATKDSIAPSSLDESDPPKNGEHWRQVN